MKIPKIETLIIFVFFGCVALWAISRCGNRRSTLVRGVTAQNEELEERPLRRDTVVLPAPTPSATVQQQPVNVQRPTVQQPTATAPVSTASPASTPVNVARPTPKPATPAATTTTPAAAAPQQKYSTLYVTIDGLKMRKTPSLKGELVTKLELYEPVFFLNKKSEKQEEISLGYEKVTDYWVKIRTQSGKEGWVFGAGVYYYKMKRKGVME